MYSQRMFRKNIQPQFFRLPGPFAGCSRPLGAIDIDHFGYRRVQYLIILIFAIYIVKLFIFYKKYTTTRLLSDRVSHLLLSP